MRRIADKYAHSRLMSLGLERAAAQTACDPAFEMDEQRHHDQRERGDHDSDRRMFGRTPFEQRADGIIGDITRQ